MTKHPMFTELSDPAQLKLALSRYWHLSIKDQNRVKALVVQDSSPAFDGKSKTKRRKAPRRAT